MSFNMCFYYLSLPTNQRDGGGGSFISLLNGTEEKIWLLYQSLLQLLVTAKALISSTPFDSSLFPTYSNNAVWLLFIMIIMQSFRQLFFKPSATILFSSKLSPNHSELWKERLFGENALYLYLHIRPRGCQQIGCCTNVTLAE